MKSKCVNGHGARYRNKLGCVKCRRENGASVAPPPNESRKDKEARLRMQEDRREAQRLSLDLSNVKGI